jgi:O-antigen/teichoic acid export membrane protein
VSFKRGLLWTAAGQASLFAIQFGGAVIVARLLSPYEMGIFALAMAVVGVLNLIQSIGLGSYVVREPDLTPERIATAFTVNAIISLLLAAATAALGFAGSFFADDPGVRRLLLILALTPILSIFSILPLALLERQARFKAISIANVCGRLVSTIVMVVLAYGGLSYFSIAWGQCAGALITTILLCWVARRDLSWKLSMGGWREISTFGMQMIAITGVNSLAGRVSDLLLGKVTGIVALGLYNRAAGINNLFWENLHSVMGRVVFAELSRQKREGLSLRPLYLSISEMVTASLWPVFTGLAVLAVPLIRIVYGAQWLPAAMPFAILALSAVVLISVTMTWEIFVACGETARQARMEFIRAGVATGLFAIGCAVSLEAAAAARVADAVFAVAFYGPHLRRMTDTTLSDMGPIYLRSGLLTLLAVLPASILVTLAGRQAAEIPFGQLALAVALGGLLWGIGLVLMNHPLWNEARTFLKGRMRRAVA